MFLCNCATFIYLYSFYPVYIYAAVLLPKGSIKFYLSIRRDVYLLSNMMEPLHMFEDRGIWEFWCEMNCPFNVFHFAALCVCRAEGDSEQFTGGEEELCPSDSWTAETDRRADFTGELLSTFNGVLGLTIEVLVLDLNILIFWYFTFYSVKSVCSVWYSSLCAVKKPASQDVLMLNVCDALKDDGKISSKTLSD